MMMAVKNGDFMRTTIIVCMLLAASFALAQDTKNPVTSAAKDLFARQQTNLPAAIESMPAAKFSYKPTEGQNSFGHLTVHILESNHLFCSKIADLPQPKSELKDTDDKDKLVAGVKASFEFCGTALGKLDDSKLGDSIDLFGGKKSRAFALLVLTGSWSDHYSEAAMYLRLNGILPPSAQPKK
jgi:uncharacterized damage-inducible protein DinB